MNKGKMQALQDHRKKQKKAKDERRAERVAAKTSSRK
jgi:hypothetical protein